MVLGHLKSTGIPRVVNEPPENWGVTQFLGLRLSISSSQGFYKKRVNSEFKVDEDLKKERCSP